jgi:hypothetical protein
LLSTRHNFLFIHVPKTGGNSIQKALVPFSDDRLVCSSPHHDGIDRFELRSDRLDVHKHSSLQDYRAQLDSETFRGLVKITCVRNPWDRCVSHFFSPYRGSVVWSPGAFEAFIHGTVLPHAHYLALDGLSNSPFEHVDVVLRFEHLGEDFTSLCDRLGIATDALPRLNMSRREHYRSYFPTQRLIDLVAERFTLEISRFSYEF